MDETENFSPLPEEGVPEKGQPTSEIVEAPDTMAEVSKNLGYTETEAASAVRSKLLEPGIDDETFFSRLGEYRDAQGQSGSEQGEVALLLAIAKIKKDAGHSDLYREDLNDAADYAFNMGQNELVELIEKELVSLSASESSPETEGGEPNTGELVAFLKETYGDQLDEETMLAIEEELQADFDDGYGLLLTSLFEIGVEESELAQQLSERGINTYYGVSPKGATE